MLQLAVCTNPLLYNGQLGEEEIALPTGETMSAAAYVETFRDGGIVRLDGSAEAFLAKPATHSGKTGWLQPR